LIMAKDAMKVREPKVKHKANFWGRRASTGRPTKIPRTKKSPERNRQETKSLNRVASMGVSCVCGGV
jgi:hypothetical protein